MIKPEIILKIDLGKIQNAISEGKMGLTFEHDFSLLCIDELKTLGYKVEPYSSRNESYVTISWGKL